MAELSSSSVDESDALAASILIGMADFERLWKESGTTDILADARRAARS